MFAVLLDNLYRAISAPFNYCESLFSAFGLSFFVIFTCMIAITFFVTNFVVPFFRGHL